MVVDGGHYCMPTGTVAPLCHYKAGPLSGSETKLMQIHITLSTIIIMFHSIIILTYTQKLTMLSSVTIIWWIIGNCFDWQKNWNMLSISGAMIILNWTTVEGTNRPTWPPRFKELHKWLLLCVQGLSASLLSPLWNSNNNNEITKRTL